MSRAVTELAGILPDNLDSVMHLDARARQIAASLLGEPQRAPACAAANAVRRRLNMLCSVLIAGFSAPRKRKSHLSKAWRRNAGCASVLPREKVFPNDPCNFYPLPSGTFSGERSLPSNRLSGGPFHSSLVLGVVVIVHELGHFLAARALGITVEAFSVGFGPEIAGFHDRHGTRWRIAWIPLGGYVKFKGDESVASLPSAEALEKLTPSQRQRQFPRGGALAAYAHCAGGAVLELSLELCDLHRLGALHRESSISRRKSPASSQGRQRRRPDSKPGTKFSR